MNKKDLIKALAEQTEMSQEEALLFVDAFVKQITEALREGDSVNLPGFGKFIAKTRSARMARNPRTGQPMQIKSKRSVTFRPAHELKELKALSGPHGVGGGDDE